MFEAQLYEKAAKKSVDCRLCSFRCHILDGRRGICGVRENKGGTLYTHTWGRLVAENIDPIEKKPLFHFLPSSRSFSVAAAGCNFKCLNCQNSDISQAPREGGFVGGEEVSPEEIAAEAYETGCESISYTYTEPTIFFEYSHDIGVLAKQKGLKNIYVTNGYMTPECLNALEGVLDAANVDIKSFSDSFYRKVCGATLAPVLESVENMRRMGVWVELTTLVIPTLNDSEEELRALAKWIYRTDKTMPWHLSAFHPAYKMLDIAPTPVETLERAREIGLEEGLRYVYTGNVPGNRGESTYCWNCSALLIERRGFMVKKNAVADSKCPSCGSEIDGVGL